MLESQRLLARTGICCVLTARDFVTIEVQIAAEVKIIKVAKIAKIEERKNVKLLFLTPLCEF
jgi:hypothetical protein